MFRFNSAFFSIASEFTGKFAPCQGIELAPHPEGGLAITAVNDGCAMVFIGHDPRGATDEPSAVFLPSAELAKAARGIKAHERELLISGDRATVTTFQKEARPTVECPIIRASFPFPPIRAVLAKAIEYWGDCPAQVDTAGRYNLSYLQSAIKAIGGTDSIVLCPYPGGPMRLQREDLSAMVLLMPQSSQPIPPVPQWLAGHASF